MKIVSNTARYCRVGNAIYKKHEISATHSNLSVFFNIIFAIIIILMSAKMLSLLETSLTNSIESVSAATYQDTITNPYYYTELANIETGLLKQGDLDIEPVIEKTKENTETENETLAIADTQS